MEDKKNIRERAFIYGYRDVNRDMIVYVGSSHATENKKGMNDDELLEQVDMWHRKTGEAKFLKSVKNGGPYAYTCLLYTSPSPRDRPLSRMPSSA